MYPTHLLIPFLFLYDFNYYLLLDDFLFLLSKTHEYFIPYPGFI